MKMNATMNIMMNMNTKMNAKTNAKINVIWVSPTYYLTHAGRAM